VYESPRAGLKVWKSDQTRLVEWIRSLPKPVGIFATNDLRGQHVLDACAGENIAVPEQAAVIGVDNDELLCNLCNPPLSSVIPDPEQIGYEAAKWLDRLMQGETPTVMTKEIPPQGIAVRQSSDVFAVSDPILAKALRFIRERACEGMSVQDLVDHLRVSRSWLERSFRRLLNRSPQSAIRMVQIKRCKELLLSTPLSLERIAQLTGFEHPEYMSVVFKRETGDTPGHYRARQGLETHNAINGNHSRTKKRMLGVTH
jgi:LacI family transcriptional regulator